MTAFQPGELVEWRHPEGHRRRWEFEPISPNLTRVTETFDYRNGGARTLKFYELTRSAKTNARGIEATLAGLAERYPTN